jgi:hypothetical protein
VNNHEKAEQLKTIRLEEFAKKYDVSFANNNNNNNNNNNSINPDPIPVPEEEGPAGPGVAGGSRRS